MRFLVSLRKATQHANRMSMGLFLTSPQPHVDDEALYLRYGLTKTEIAFVESMVNPMPDGE